MRARLGVRTCVIMTPGDPGGRVAVGDGDGWWCVKSDRVGPRAIVIPGGGHTCVCEA